MADTDTETEETLLDKLVELTELEQEDEETAEAYKVRLVEYFAETYPNNDAGNKAFGNLDETITNWVDSATDVQRANKSAGKNRQKRLPEIAGLEEDAKPARGRAADSNGAKKGRAAAKEKPERKGRDPEGNVFFKVGGFLADKPTMTVDELAKAAGPQYNERTVKRVHRLFRAVHGVLVKHGKIAAAA